MHVEIGVRSSLDPAQKVPLLRVQLTRPFTTLTPPVAFAGRLGGQSGLLWYTRWFNLAVWAQWPTNNQSQGEIHGTQH